MNLIERYIEEVGKHLPNKTRTDIQTEIRSTLEDMLEDRAQASGQAVDDVLRKAILKEYGAPEKVAASYLPERYLIGPKLFPIFMLVIKIVASVLTGVALLGFGVRYGASAQTSAALVEILGKTLLEYVGGIISAFGNIVLVFAVLQWVLPSSEFEDETQAGEWDPSDMEKEPEPDEVRMAAPILAIVVITVALLKFNFYPQIIVTGFFNKEGWVFLPQLTADFSRYLPWINAILLPHILLNIILLRQGKWTVTTRWFNVALNLISIVAAYLLLRGPALIAFDEQAVLNMVQNAEAGATLVKILRTPVPIALFVVLVVESIETAQSIYKLVFKNKPVLPFKA